MERCYTLIDEETRRIAGEGALDCGLLPLDADRRSVRFAHECVQHALATLVPFRSGYVGFGDDSAYCLVTLRAPDGQLWELFYDSDAMGAFGTRGDQSGLRLSRCTPQQADSFRTHNCTEDNEAAERYIWSFRRDRIPAQTEPSGSQ